MLSHIVHRYRILTTLLTKGVCLGVLLFTLSTSVGCGGGSAGTGGGTTAFIGQVVTTDQKPVEGVTVTIVETGASGTTDSNGNFRIESDVPADDSEIQFEVASEDQAVVATFTSNSPVDPATTVNIDLEIDQENRQITVTRFEVLVQIVGKCDFAFENRRTIRQSNALASGTSCTAKVWVRGDSGSSARIPIVVQARGCGENEAWVTEGRSQTRRGSGEIVGQINFTYVDDPQHCIYRIAVLPGPEGKRESFIYEIHTFQKQSFDRESVTR